MGCYGRFALNRAACPGLELPEFFNLAGELGLGGVELRNDLSGRGIIDALRPSEARAISEEVGIAILSINAVQRFNAAALRSEVEEEIERLVGLALEIGCKRVVLCPMNDLGEGSGGTQEGMFEETVGALAALRGFFEESGVFGCIEPLGCARSSLRSKVLAWRAIAASGGKNYRLVHDTFHHMLGPDAQEPALDRSYEVRVTGLVHISGVATRTVPLEHLFDRHRGLVFPSDRLESKKQLRWLIEHGYQGPVSLEPFAPEIQRLDYARLKRALEATLRYLTTPQGPPGDTLLEGPAPSR